MQQQCRCVAAAAAGERDLRAQALQPRALKLVERGELGDRQQLERRVRCRSIELGLRGSQGPPAPLRRIGGQLRRVREVRSSCRRAPTGPRPVGRALELGGHLLVHTHRRVGTMPRTTIGIGTRIRCLSQCPMHSSALREDRRSVHSGPHQWMPEADTRSDLNQLRVFRRAERAPFDAERIGSAPDERRVADRLGRGEQEQSLGCLRQFTRALEIVMLEPAREVCRGRELKAACQLRRAPVPRKIEQSERVPTGFRNYAVPDAGVEAARDGSAEQGSCIFLRQPAQYQLGQTTEVLPGARLADGDDDRHRFRQQASRDKAEDQPRGLVQPLRIFDQAEQRPLLGRGGKQAEHGESDHEPIGDVTCCEAQGDI